MFQWCGQSRLRCDSGSVWLKHHTQLPSMYVHGMILDEFRWQYCFFDSWDVHHFHSGNVRRPSCAYRVVLGRCNIRCLRFIELSWVGKNTNIMKPTSGRLDVCKSGVCEAGLNRNMEWGVGVCTYVEKDCRKEVHTAVVALSNSANPRSAQLKKK